MSFMFERVRCSSLERILIRSETFISEHFLLRERSFGATPTQNHAESKLKSLKGTKSHNCYLASDSKVGIINFRPLPCLETCCLTPQSWKQNVPEHTKCKWGDYTGQWKYWNFENDGGGWAIEDDDLSDN